MILFLGLWAELANTILENRQEFLASVVEAQLGPSPAEVEAFAREMPSKWLWRTL
jgi:hypothetical protein